MPVVSFLQHPPGPTSFCLGRVFAHSSGCCQTACHQRDNVLLATTISFAQLGKAVSELLGAVTTSTWDERVLGRPGSQLPSTGPAGPPLVGISRPRHLRSAQ